MYISNKLSYVNFILFYKMQKIDKITRLLRIKKQNILIFCCEYDMKSALYQPDNAYQIFHLVAGIKKYEIVAMGQIIKHIRTLLI